MTRQDWEEVREELARSTYCHTTQHDTPTTKESN